MSFWLAAALVLGSINSGGIREDVKCNADAVEKANTQQLGTILEELETTTFFRLFRVNLERKCYREHEETTCGGGPNEAAPFGVEEKGPKKCDLTMDQGFGMGFGMAVDTQLSDKEVASKTDGEPCEPSRPEFWLDICSNIPTELSEHVNLVKNPEAFTGYNGTDVWNRIYQEANPDQRDTSELCFEERVLYKLLSGMHASINIHISNAYYPPTKKSPGYKPNPKRFMEQYADKTQYLNNLHFTFLVALRALSKLSPIEDHLMKIIHTGDTPEDHRARSLLGRLLGAQIMQSCSPVFSAFDESLMFQQPECEAELAQQKTKFKQVFQNISKELDCVTCQKCKLHGKLFLLGLGTALKVLLVPTDLLVKDPISQDELVALINTLGKMSSSIMHIDTLQKLAKQELEDDHEEVDTQQSPPPSPPQVDGGSTITFSTVDTAVGRIASSRKQNYITEEQEVQLLELSLKPDECHRRNGVLSLARHYSEEDFARHAVRTILSEDISESKTDVVVIGGGLAGLTTALSLVDNGFRVLLVEKESLIGGNSAKASSGINGVSKTLFQEDDTTEVFLSDMLTGGGMNETTPLISTFVQESGPAVEYLKNRVGMDLSQVVQMGGHSHPRTYRPQHGMAGAEITLSLNAKAEESPLFTYMKKTRALKLLTSSSGAVTGVRIQTAGEEPVDISSTGVVIATGGFALGRSDDSFLNKYRPDLNSFASTNGKWCTGDGHKMAADLGANMVDMEVIQVHPTGFIDPRSPDHATKTLCAEMLRGLGAVLLLRNGSRFVNELGTRKHISSVMHDIDPSLEFIILMGEKTSEMADKHAKLYSTKGLLQEYNTLSDVASWMGIPTSTLDATLEEYDTNAAANFDPFGKKQFKGTPMTGSKRWFAGKITPVLHYSMGGLEIDEMGRVLNKDKKAITGLYAAGEVAGGLHGHNRLGGNALTECVVFGRLVAKALATDLLQKSTKKAAPSETKKKNTKDSWKDNKITMEEVAKHSSPSDCWTVIHGEVYDLTDFIDEHPAGPESITNIAGKDGTADFDMAHSKATLAVFKPVGILDS
eukprot:TRINITY_DN8921_c0_g1_i1.p1 TRINITY_DN8921_c0_g1~~TRINITY_DN8921_c0_g1_i1.p1  ORF type:complete len:1055 (+),score=213.92 TRINITY_DN8921_c0_g1_i1:57-3221(+)